LRPLEENDNRWGKAEEPDPCAQTGAPQRLSGELQYRLSREISRVWSLWRNYFQSKSAALAPAPAPSSWRPDSDAPQRPWRSRRRSWRRGIGSTATFAFRLAGWVLQVLGIACLRCQCLRSTQPGYPTVDTLGARCTALTARWLASPFGTPGIAGPAPASRCTVWSMEEAPTFFRTPEPPGMVTSPDSLEFRTRPDPVSREQLLSPRGRY